MDDQTIAALTLCFDKSPEEAIRFLKSRGIKIAWDWKKQLDAIKQHAFTVAKVANADLLQTIKDSIDKAMEKGESFDKFRKSITPILETKGFTKREDGSEWRLDTIYRTNLQSAYMAGRYNQMIEVADEFPYWELVAVMDNRTTNGCSNVNGTILRYDDAFWQTNYPPRHYKCRSRVRALSSQQVMKLGLKPTAPSKVANIKPAEGFDTSPGEWKPDLSKYSPDIRNQLEQCL